MIAIKLILQSLAGVAVVGSAVAGGYQLMNTEPLEFEYLLVDSGTLPTTNQDTTPLTIDEAKKKNYQCKSVKKDLDVSCEIFKTSSETTPVSLDLEKLSSNDLLVKEAIKASTNYVLKVKKSFSESSTISLVTKDSSKTFATLTTKYKLGSDLTNVKTNLIIVQSINLASTATSSITPSTRKFKCLIEGSREKIDCDVYKPTTAKTANNFSSTDFSSIALIENASQLTNSNFFVLDLKTNKFSKEQFRNKKISLTHVATATGSTETKISDLIFDQAVVGHLSTETNKFGYPIAPSNEVYYVAQTVAIEDSKLPDLELFTAKAESTSSSKNFKCQLSGSTDESKTDISCQMFSLSAFDGTKKSLTFESLKVANTEIKTKTALTAAKYLKLKINTTHMSSLNWTSNVETTIDIVPLTTPADAAKPKYASLKLLAKEEKEKLLGKTQFVVAKASAALTSSSSPLSLKCKLGTETSTDCDVYKFATQPTEATAAYKDLSFASITKASASTDITANHFYLVDLKTPAKYDIKTDASQQVIAVTNSSESTPTFNLNVESPLLGHLETSATTGKFIFLK